MNDLSHEADAIEVLIADDHYAVRMSLAILIEVCDDMEVAGEAANGQEAITLCEQLKPDVVLMDIHMPGMDGLSATEIIRQNNPDIAIIILTGSGSEENQAKAFQAGASDFLMKNVSIDVLAGSIRSAVE